MKMLDYVQLAHVRMGENLERSSELVAQLVDIFQSGSFDALRIVASGSSLPCLPIAPAITCKMPCKCRCPL